MTDLVGQTFGKYRLTRLLGHEAATEVYLGEHLFFSNRAVIKVWGALP